MDILKAIETVGNQRTATATERTIQLQSIGHVPAVEAQELKIGSVTIWNFGYTETITKILKETKTQIIFEIVSDSSGTVHQRRMKKTRLVGFKK